MKHLFHRRHTDETHRNAYKQNTTGTPTQSRLKNAQRKHIPHQNQSTKTNEYMLFPIPQTDKLIHETRYPYSPTCSSPNDLYHHQLLLSFSRQVPMPQNLVVGYSPLTLLLLNNTSGPIWETDTFFCNKNGVGWSTHVLQPLCFWTKTMSKIQLWNITNKRRTCNWFLPFWAICCMPRNSNKCTTNWMTQVFPCQW